jgi:hypothetical protein
MSSSTVTRVVLDNLSTHTAGALYEAFPAPEAHRILQRLEFHYTPKHASWLNKVEIEIGVLRGQCLDRRIGERTRLVSEDSFKPGALRGPMRQDVLPRQIDQHDGVVGRGDLVAHPEGDMTCRHGEDVAL